MAGRSFLIRSHKEEESNAGTSRTNSMIEACKATWILIFRWQAEDGAAPYAGAAAGEPSPLSVGRLFRSMDEEFGLALTAELTHGGRPAATELNRGRRVGGYGAQARARPSAAAEWG